MSSNKVFFFVVAHQREKILGRQTAGNKPATCRWRGESEKPGQDESQKWGSYCRPWGTSEKFRTSKSELLLLKTEYKEQDNKQASLISNEIANTRGIFSNLCTSAVQLTGYWVKLWHFSWDWLDKADASIPMPQNLMFPFILSNTCHAVLICQFHFHFYTTIRGLLSVQRNTENRIKLKLSRTLFSRLLNSCFSCIHVPSSSVAFTIWYAFFCADHPQSVEFLCRTITTRNNSLYIDKTPVSFPGSSTSKRGPWELGWRRPKFYISWQLVWQLVCHFGDLFVCLFFYFLDWW